MVVDFYSREGRELFQREVRKRMEAPFFMERNPAEMLVAALLAPSISSIDEDRPDSDG